MYDFLIYEKYSSLLKSEMAVHSSILIWKIPWTEEPDGLQSMGPHKESDMTEQLSILTLIPLSFIFSYNFKDISSLTAKQLYLQSMLLICIVLPKKSVQIGDSSI